MGRITFAVVLAVVFTIPAFSETIKKNQKRKVASTETRKSELRANAQIPGLVDRNWSLKLGLFGGYSRLGTNATTEQQARQNANLQNSGSFGGFADFRIEKYFGAEVEGFYGIGSAGDVNQVDRISGTVTNERRSLRQFGILSHAKVQLPLIWDRFRLEPTLGGGFGSLAVRTETTDNKSGAQTTTTNDVQGPYAVVGFEVEPVSDVVILADYARSFAASATTAVNVPGTQGQDRELAGGRFERVRAGAYYRFSRSFMAGGQYIGRRLGFDAASGRTEENLDQFVGMILLGL